MNMNRRKLLTQLAVGSLTVAVGSAWAAQPVVEIIAFAHPPVQSALKPLRDWLGTQTGKLRVVEIDMESAAAEQRLKAMGLKGHISIVVLIDGAYTHKLQDGRGVEFVSFPSGPGTPAGVKGAWSAEDVKQVLKTRKS